jgi:hypothetical protein
MNARVATLLVALLVLVGGGALYYYQQVRAQKPAGLAALGKPVLKSLKAADIASIQIREPQAALTLERKDSGLDDRRARRLLPLTWSACASSS